MQFLTDNYVWFMVGGIIILMAIVGYLADKNDFGRKEVQERMQKKPKEKPEKKEKEEPQPEKIEIPNKPLGEVINENAGVETEVSVDNNEDLYAPLTSEKTDDLSQNNEDLYAPLDGAGDYAESNEDLYAPLTNEVPENSPEMIDQQTKSLSEQDTVTVLSEPVANDSVIESEIEEPIASEPETDVWTIENEPKVEPEVVTSDEEDIWKF